MSPTKHRRLHPTRFLVKRPTFDLQTATARFPYRLGELSFEETLVFPTGFAPEMAASPLFQQALNLTACIIGVSYFKLLAPLEIAMPDFSLTPSQQKLVLDVYENGLGEFYARNTLSRFGKISLNVKTAAPESAPVFVPASKALILIGGGKDSLVSAQLALDMGKDFTPFAVNPKGPILASAKGISLAPLFVKRTLDPEMIRLGKLEGYYNGHVPATAINSMIALLTALLFGYDEIILSNERSASQGNAAHDGRFVNHQHSKSLAFENLLRAALFELTGANLNYYSLLRPFSELHIAGIFSRTTRFDKSFSSCNANFTLGSSPERLWCGACPKCHFVFLIFAPFMDPERLCAIFNGNVLDNPAHLASFRQLCGLEGQKPWECVGEILEAAAALFALTKNSRWKDFALVSTLGSELEAFYGEARLRTSWNDLMQNSDMQDANTHNIPPVLHAAITKLTSP